MRGRNGRKALTNELKETVLMLSTALLVMWFLFCANISNLISRYVMRSTEQVSNQVIGEMENYFLKIEEMSIKLSADSSVKALVKEDGLAAVKRAGDIEDEIDSLVGGGIPVDNLLVCGMNGNFYRFKGTLDNTSIKYIMSQLEKPEFDNYIEIRINDLDYLGYTYPIYSDREKIGSIAVLTDEEEIRKFFVDNTPNMNIKIAIAGDGKVLVTSKDEYRGMSIDEISKDNDRIVRRRVGFTPFELLVLYEESNRRMNFLFLFYMILMAGILWLIIETFVHFWKKKFFMPIQSVITEVESFDGGRGESVAYTGLEHFDGLVKGINDMVERIELKEKEVFEATYSLQEAELKKQKALIVSLKKQISAHFTVNVLYIIKTLSQAGENDKAGLLCDGLSYLLRYANAGDSFINGMEEFYMLQKYADIMGIRYSERFDIDVEMDDELSKIEIPRMLLQPVLENSILHGIVEKEETDFTGHIKVYCKIYDTYVEFHIEDNGKGMNEEELNRLRTKIKEAEGDSVEVEGLSHVALVNIERRIISYFGEEYGISVESREGSGTSVIVKLPKNEIG